MIKNIIIAPSILSADFSCLCDDISKVEKAGAQWLHIDVMDGHFVPNITIGPVVVKNIRKCSKLFFDTHLMIKNPEKYWNEFYKAGADLITFHEEVNCDKLKLIKKIKSAGIKAGISVKPKSDISKILKYLPYLDLVLVMTVEPGFGGQKFMPEMMKKVKEIRSIIQTGNMKCYLEVDGGINPETAAVAARSGADVLVAGNSIFGADNPGKAFRNILKAASK